MAGNTPLASVDVLIVRVRFVVEFAALRWVVLQLNGYVIHAETRRDNAA